MNTTTLTENDNSCTYCGCDLTQRIVVKAADGNVCTDCQDEFLTTLPDWDTEIETANDSMSGED